MNFFFNTETDRLDFLISDDNGTDIVKAASFAISTNGIKHQKKKDLPFPLQDVDYTKEELRVINALLDMDEKKKKKDLFPFCIPDIPVLGMDEKESKEYWRKMRGGK